MANVPTLPLNPQGAIPLLGFGTWELTGDDCPRGVEMALHCGYRHIDTADAYGNHVQVGEGIRASGVPREQFFLTTKVWRENLKYNDVLNSCQRFLEEIGVEYIDLLLAHWPNNDIRFDEQFRAFKKLIDDGLIRACGVSNFTASRLQRALDLDIVPISDNQVEYHPLLNQKELHQFCKKNNVVLTAYSPLARGKVAENPTMQEVAKKYGKSPAQIAIRWLLQKEIVTIPKATSREHIESNFDVFSFELSPEDFNTIDNIKDTQRLVSWEVGEFDK